MYLLYRAAKTSKSATVTCFPTSTDAGARALSIWLKVELMSPPHDRGPEAVDSQ